MSPSRIQAVQSIPFPPLPFPWPQTAALGKPQEPRPGVAPTSGICGHRGDTGEVKTPLDVPKSSAGWQPQPWHSGNPAGSGAGAAFSGIPMGCVRYPQQLRGEQRAGKASVLFRGTKEAGKLGLGLFLGGFPLEIHIMEWCLLFFLTENP